MNYIININYMMIYWNNQYIKADYEIKEIAIIKIKVDDMFNKNLKSGLNMQLIFVINYSIITKL